MRVAVTAEASANTAVMRAESEHRGLLKNLARLMAPPTDDKEPLPGAAEPTLDTTDSPDIVVELVAIEQQGGYSRVCPHLYVKTMTAQSSSST